MIKKFTCILCPNGCEIEAEIEKAAETSQGEIIIRSVRGNRCQKGAEYVSQEVINPLRNIASSVLITEGTYPLCSVRLTEPIPKKRIREVMEEIKKLRLTAPVRAGQVLISNVLGLSSDVIATRNVDRIS